MDDEIVVSSEVALTDSFITEAPPLEPESSSVADSTEETAALSVGVMIVQVHQVMLKDIRSWAWWMLGFGVLNFVMSGLSGVGWGLLLVVMGAGSFVFQDAAMYVVYAVTLMWAALSNFNSASTGWVVFALFQVWMAYRVGRSYFRFRENQQEYRQWMRVMEPARVDPVELTARWFPWLGGLLGAVVLLGTVALVVGLFAIIMLEVAGGEIWYGLGMQVVVNTAVLGFAVSLAALLSHHRYKGIAIVGICSSGLVLLLWLALVWFG